MPVSTKEKEVLDGTIVRLWKEPIKCRDATLIITLSDHEINE
jgi:hypothetical protein